MGLKVGKELAATFMRDDIGDLSFAELGLSQGEERIIDREGRRPGRLWLLFQKVSSLVAELFDDQRLRRWMVAVR